MSTAPIHPLARDKPYHIPLPFLILAWLTYIPIRLLIIFPVLILGYLVAIILQIGTDVKKPITGVRAKIAYLTSIFYSRMLFFGHGLIMI